MKLTLIHMILLVSNLALADSFTIIHNKKEYLCERTSDSRPNPLQEAECAAKVYKSDKFTKEEAKEVCRKAQNLNPADCSIFAIHFFTTTEAVELCLGANSGSPGICASMALKEGFTKPEVLQLCKNSGGITNAECAIQAYLPGPYSKEEAIELCRQK